MSSPISSLSKQFQGFNFDEKKQANETDEKKECEVPNYVDKPCYSRETGAKTAPVWRVASLNSNQIISGSYSTQGNLWSFDSSATNPLKHVAVLSAHKGNVLSVAKLNEETAITGSAQGTLSFWSTSQGKWIKKIKCDAPEGFYSLTSLLGESIAAGPCQQPPYSRKKNWNYGIKIFNAETGKLENLLQGHKGGVSALTYIKDKAFASSSADGTVKIWKSDSEKEVLSSDVHNEYVYSIANLNGSSLISGGKDKKIHQLDITTGKSIRWFIHGEEGEAHSSTVYDVDTLGRNLIVSGSRDCLVKVWDSRLKTCIKTLDPEDGFVYGVSFSSNGEIIAGTAGYQPVADEKKKKAKKFEGNVVVWSSSFSEEHKK